MKLYVDKYLSPYLCGYRKGYSAQYALLAMNKDQYIFQYIDKYS